MLRLEDTLSRGASRSYSIRANAEALALLALLGLAVLAASFASAGPESTRLVYAPGKIVPVPASIPHEAGDMVDRRILPDLLWISRRFPIYVTDGYSGPLPNGKRAGCDRCHTRRSDHYNGLAVDVVPLSGGTGCTRGWLPITRLARWAEPTQGKPRAPFRWVGYDGDAGHGCGDHLHLSWNHATAPEYRLADWVEILSGSGVEPTPKPPAPEEDAAPAPAPGPSGGVSQFQSGGVSAHG